MKIIVYFLLTLFCCPLMHAQNISVRKGKIDSLITLMERITSSERNKSFKRHVFNDIDLEKAKEYLYSCYAYDEVELLKRIKILSNEWDYKVRSGQEPNLESPAVRLKLIKNALEEKYGKEYIGFLETPYFIKAKIIENNYGSYNVNKTGSVKTAEVILKVEVLDVLKGDGIFSIGDTIIVSYLPLWFRYSSSQIVFNVDAIYLLPLRHWSPSGKKDPFALTLKIDNINAIYKYEAGEIISLLEPNKDMINYISFKGEFISKYILDK